MLKFEKELDSLLFEHFTSTDKQGEIKQLINQEIQNARKLTDEKKEKIWDWITNNNNMVGDWEDYYLDYNKSPELWKIIEEGEINGK